MYTILKELRKRQGLTQREVAERLRVETSTYAKVEQGKNRLMDCYYDGLAELFCVERAKLFELYQRGDEEIMEGRISVSLTINNEMDFGTVLTHDYCYVNMCQGPDFFQFKLPRAEAAPFVRKLDFDCRALQTAFADIGGEFNDVYNSCYEEDGDYVVFTAFLLGDVEINGKEYGERTAINVLDEIDTETVDVVCSVVCEDIDEAKAFQLRLDVVEFEDKEDKLAGFEAISYPPALGDLPWELQEALYGREDNERLRSIDEILAIAQRNDYRLTEKEARRLFAAWCC